MDVAITRMSSKGQIVIPASMRADIPEGEKLLIIREGERYILKPLADLEPALREDLLFAEKTEQAFEEYRKGGLPKKSVREFSDELASWGASPGTRTSKRPSERSGTNSSGSG